MAEFRTRNWKESTQEDDWDRDGNNRLEDEHRRKEQRRRELKKISFVKMEEDEETWLLGNPHKRETSKEEKEYNWWMGYSTAVATPFIPTVALKVWRKGCWEMYKVYYSQWTDTWLKDKSHLTWNPHVSLICLPNTFHMVI